MGKILAEYWQTILAIKTLLVIPSVARDLFSTGAPP